ncbi:hypothetical protein [Dongia deserti]|uniref:hypothetical protein n=1 Tax=Dongia deserti TaxID=2268030 RepID=UPI000E646DED|nr:hypothetical protein [Dongia deserti]
MPFITISRGHTLPGGASAKLAFPKKGKTRLTLAVDATLAGKLKWKLGGVIGIQAGTEEDAGKVRLAPAPRGWKLGEHGRQASHFSIATRPWWNAVQMKGLEPAGFIECDSEVSGQALTITLPRGWFPDDEA